MWENLLLQLAADRAQEMLKATMMLDKQKDEWMNCNRLMILIELFHDLYRKNTKLRAKP